MMNIPFSTITHSDAVEFMQSCQNNVFDAIVTDPPYGVTQDSDDYVAIDWISQAYRILKRDAAMMILCGQATFREFWGATEKAGFKWLNTIVWWHRNTLSRQKRRFAVQYDPILYLAKGDFRHHIDSVRVPYRSKDRLRYPCNNKKAKNWRPNPLGAMCPDVWDDIPAVTTTARSGNDPKFDHKWQKPVRLFERMIKAICVRGDVMFDPFVGSGSSCMAAHHCGVHYVGVDNDLRCVEMSNQRLEGKLETMKTKTEKRKDLFE